MKESLIKANKWHKGGGKKCRWSPVGLGGSTGGHRGVHM